MLSFWLSCEMLSFFGLSSEMLSSGMLSCGCSHLVCYHLGYVVVIQNLVCHLGCYKGDFHLEFCHVGCTVFARLWDAMYGVVI